MRGPLVATALLAIAVGAVAGGLGARILVVRAAAPSLTTESGWSSGPEPFVGPAWFSSVLRRAVRAQTAPAALPPRELASFDCDRDADSRPLAGTSTYRLRFAAETLPPADAFWTLDAIPRAGAAPSAEPAAAISSRTTPLRRQPNGPLDITIGGTPPDDPLANWLAAPPGAFRLVLRLYAPGLATRAQNWRPPAVARRETAA